MPADGPDLPDPEPEAASPVVRRVGLVLGPLLFLVLLAWRSGPLDDAQRKVAAVTALTATWWITAALPIGITSLVPAALLPLLGVMGAREIAPRYMQDLVFLFLGAFIIALGLERWNVHRRMALFIISLVGTRPRQLVLGFMIASAFLSFWINNTSTTLLMLPIGMAVVAAVRDVAPGERDPFAISLLLAMAYSASVGGMATPVGTAPNQVFLGQFAARFPDAPGLSFGQWMLAWVPVVALFVPVGWWLLTRVALRVPAESERGIAVIRQERQALGPMSGPEMAMAGVFAATALLWVTRPAWAGWVLPDSIARPKTFVTDATIATAMAILCFVIPVGKGGVRLMDWRTASRMPWEVLLLIGGGFAIAAAFQSSGLDELVGAALGPWLAGRSTWITVGAVVVLMAALTEVTSNTATTAVLLPVMGQAAIAAGVSPLLFMVPATIAASAAFMLPVATPPNAVVFSSRQVPAPTMARVGLWMNLAMATLIVVVFQLWVRAVLGIGASVPDWAR